MADTFLITSNDKVLKTMQEIELETLKDFDEICRKHGIKYSLGGGTNLGQVRHGGFIPWDDDIDVDMTVENYNKFMAIAEQELDSDKYFLRCRKTDPKHLRSASRIENKTTRLGKKLWDKRGEEVGVFIDIFRWSYLPNNDFLRKRVTNLLFFIRGLENQKEFKSIPFKMKKAAHFPLMILCSIMPASLMIKIDDALCNCCKGKKTDWIIDDAIINGNHGGYLAEGIDEYVDAKFEGVTVMLKKNSHNFLRTIYGEHYNEWLPPVKRISHHSWTKVDFGDYAKKYDLPENYREYLSIEYTPRKLRRMQELTIEMLEKVEDICGKHNLECYRAIESNLMSEEYSNRFEGLWNGPGKIAMPREDFDRFSRICQDELGNKYFYQTNRTDREFHYAHARIRLNYTYLKETRIPISIEKNINNGLFIEIIPLVTTSNNKGERRKHLRRIKRKNTFLSIKWRKNSPKPFLKANIKQKLKIMMLLPFKVNTVASWVEKEQLRYKEEISSYCLDGTGAELGGIILDRNKLKKGQRIEIKSEKPVPENIKNFIDNIEKVHEICHMTYFEDPDYQLSILRYDEKEKKILTNKEMLGYE